MLEESAFLSSVIWQYCEYTHYNTSRANMPHCNMEPSAISRPQSWVYMSHSRRLLAAPSTARAVISAVVLSCACEMTGTR
jgi:hypothetical protein